MQKQLFWFFYLTSSTQLPFKYCTLNINTLLKWKYRWIWQHSYLDNLHSSSMSSFYFSLLFGWLGWLGFALYFWTKLKCRQALGCKLSEFLLCASAKRRGMPTEFVVGFGNFVLFLFSIAKHYAWMCLIKFKFHKYVWVTANNIIRLYKKAARHTFPCTKIELNRKYSLNHNYISLKRQPNATKQIKMFKFVSIIILVLCTNSLVKFCCRSCSSIAAVKIVAATPILCCHFCCCLTLLVKLTMSHGGNDFVILIQLKYLINIIYCKVP